MKQSKILHIAANRRCLGKLENVQRLGLFSLSLSNCVLFLFQKCETAGKGIFTILDFKPHSFSQICKTTFATMAVSVACIIYILDRSD